MSAGRLERAHLDDLRSVRTQFGRAAATRKARLLGACSERALADPRIVRDYHDLLLFLEAYADDAKIRSLVRSELARVADAARRLVRSSRALRILRNTGIVLTREVIYERIWGYDFGPTSNSLDVYVGYLRRKTEAGGEPRLIHTVRGVGYVLREA